MVVINLNGYSATNPNGQFLLLGTSESYGIEQLQIVPGPEWEGLTITATFSANGTALASPIVVPENGIIDVPPGATAQALPASAPGVIVFRGVSDGMQRITTNILYIVLDHGPVDGTAPAPPASGGGYVIGSGLILDPETNTLSVDTTDQVEEANTLPITSSAVYATVGNIDALLQTI